MKIVQVSALVLLSFASAACEFVVLAGQSVTISMGERITGVEQMGQVRSSAGVRVEPGGRFTLVNGTVVGGRATLAEFDPQPSPGILAAGAEVSISGGSVEGGAIVAPAGAQLMRKGSQGIFVDQTMLRISGGRLRGGLVPGGFAGEAVQTNNSRVLISGGDLSTLTLVGSKSSISGGRIQGFAAFPFFALDGPIEIPISLPQPSVRPPPVSVAPPTQPDSCVELTGGQVSSPIFLRQSRMLVRGLSFNLPFGEVVLPAQRSVFRLTGTLMDGSPIDVMIDATLSRVVLGPTTLNQLAVPFCTP